jgi:hypothetical protein
MILWLILGYIGCKWLFSLVEKQTCANKACDRMCESNERFMDWRMRNQGVYIGLSEEGQKLVKDHIAAWDEFWKTHPYIKPNLEHREWLISLLHELPPKTPHEMPIRRPRPQSEAFLTLR